MIIQLLLDLIYNLFALLTLPINIPSLPASVTDMMNTLFGYISSGLSVLAVYCDLNYLIVLLGIIIAIDVALSLYNLVMYLIKKIPFFGIQ